MSNTRLSRKGKFELIRATVDGDNDPTPQLHCFTWFSVWAEFRLPRGCVIQSITDPSILFYSTGRGRFVELQENDYAGIVSQAATSTATIISGVSGWSIARDTTLGLMSGGV